MYIGKLDLPQKMKVRKRGGNVRVYICVEIVGTHSHCFGFVSAMCPWFRSCTREDPFVVLLCAYVVKVRLPLPRLHDHWVIFTIAEDLSRSMTYNGTIKKILTANAMTSKINRRRRIA